MSPHERATDFANLDMILSYTHSPSLLELNNAEIADREPANYSYKGKTTLHTVMEGLFISFQV